MWGRYQIKRLPRLPPQQYPLRQHLLTQTPLMALTRWGWSGPQATTGPSAVLCQMEHTAVEAADLNWDRQFRPWFIDTMVDLHCLGSSFPFCSPLPSWYSWYLEKGGALKALPVPGDSRTRKCFLAIPNTKYGPLPLCFLDWLCPDEIRTGIGP